MSKEKWTVQDIKDILINPMTARIGFAGVPGIIEEAQWIEVNVKLIEEIGAEKWLTTLLKLLREMPLKYEVRKTK